MRSHQNSSENSMTRIVIGVAVLVACLSIFGCASFTETYFVEVEECRPGWSEPHSSFIKLDLNGEAFFTQSKFEMGWYDRRAVDTLFSTIDGQDKPPTEPTVDQSGQTISREEGMDCSRGTNKQQVWRRTRIYGPNGKAIGDAAGKRLVMFASGNPNNLVNRISTTVNTLATSEQVAGLLRRKELSEMSDEGLEMALVGKRYGALAVEAQELVRWLEQANATPTFGALKSKLSALSSHAESINHDK